MLLLLFHYIVGRASQEAKKRSMWFSKGSLINYVFPPVVKALAW